MARADSRVPENVAFRITGTAIADTESARLEADGVYYDVPDANVVATAHWVGAGARNDFDDPANWVCTNMVGALAVGAVPGNRSSVFFGVLNFDLTNAATIAKLSTYQSVALEPLATLVTDCDWSGISANDNLFAGNAINLAGHTLRLTCPDGTSQQAFTVTDAEVNRGLFVVSVPENATFENTRITIGGTAAFVKDGAGVFMAHCYGQTYSGGTTVAAGTLRLYNDDVANSSTFSPIRSGPQPLGVHHACVYVEAGAFYDINGIYDINAYPIVLRGGTLTNSKAQTQYAWGSIGNVTLEADSTIDVSIPTVVFSGGTAIFNLNGHTLTAQFPTTDTRPNLYMYGAAISNGTFVVAGNGYFDLNSAATAADTATLDIDSFMILNAAITVSNYVARYAGTDANTHGSAAIHVLSSFKPLSDRYYRTVLHEGAAIDLSALSDTMKSSTPIGTLSYDAAASNITINVGARTLQSDEHLIAWDAIPEGVTFTLVGDNVDGSKMCVIENGVFYDVATDSRLVVRAVWTGLAGDGDISNPVNWACVNAHGNSVPNGVPGVSANVQISGTYGTSVATAAAMPWQSVTFGSISLMDDMDMRGFENFFSLVASGSTIDLRGHKLYVNAPNGNPPVALTVTDSTSAAPGELHITVPSGATFTNNRITLSGNLKLVKEGPGVFTPQVYNLAYTGGNVIVEGTLKLYNTNKDNSEYAFDQKNYPRPLGAYGVPVVVESGATFDINGVYGTNNQQFRLSGGTFISSYNQTHTTWGGLGNVTLSDDSFMNVGNSIVATSPYNLGGHTFNVSLASGKAFYLRSVVQDGTLCITGAGTLQTLNNNVAGSQTMDFDVAAALNVGATLNVRNYVARYEGSSNAGTAALNVYGTFTPVTDNFYGCTMQNGSTIDLTSKTEVWSTTGAFTSGANTVTFAANSVVNVALDADRELTFDERGLAQVVSWEAAPPDTTKFKLTGPALESKRSLLKRSDGLYLLRATMMVIIR